MKNQNRNLLVLMRNEKMSEQAIENEVDCLNNLLCTIESPELFCNVNELVFRNRITQRNKRILKETRLQKLKPFVFLVNKN